MNKKLQKLLNTSYPQNYIIRHSFTGAVIITIFCFGFSALYKPADFHASRNLSYESTMLIYGLISGLSVMLLIRILRNLKWFDANRWTFLKELIAVVLVLSGTCTVIYLMGFLIETAGNRLNFRTFLNSFKNVFSVGIIPFAFFTAANYPHLFSKRIKNDGGKNFPADTSDQAPEDPVKITSQLKKEELNFYPSQFLYAESDGNYVIFYLNTNNQVKKQIIRNSISNIEQQLSEIPFFLRTHRSFIVNLKKVKSRQGNILGYQLKLNETEFKIPVSREKTKAFNTLFAEYHNF